MRRLLVREEEMGKNKTGRTDAVPAAKRLGSMSLSMLLALLLALNIGCGSTAVDSGSAAQVAESAADGTSENGSESASDGTSEDGSGSASENDPKAGADTKEETGEPSASGLPEEAEGISLEEIPSYSGDAFVAVNENMPFFTEDDCTGEPFEEYSAFDELGRCGAAFANVCQEIMPTEERGAIGHVRPSGWHTVKYDNVDGKYLYNRCHLIGYQLAGENANEQNLITGTRYLNTEGMLPFENEVADYVKETGNHVLYRVTPMFEKDNLVADGVLMEAWSVEDDGAGVCFNVFVYNVQPGIGIDFATGESWKEDKGTSSADKDAKDGGKPSKDTAASGKGGSKQEDDPPEADAGGDVQNAEYILNTNTKKFHYPTCSSVRQMSDANKQEYVGTREELIANGYDPCGRCHP